MSRLLERLQRAQRRGQRLNEGPLVVDVTRGQIRLERGSRDAIDAAERVAIVAQYSATPVQPLSLSRYLAALDASGYATAVLAKLAGRVITIDTDETQQQQAKAVLDRLGLTNIDYRIGDGLVNPPIATVSAIYVGGSCPVMPETLRSKLPAGGRMAVIVGQEPVMRALLVQCNGEAGCEQSVMFDTVAPALGGPAVKKPSSFRF